MRALLSSEAELASEIASGTESLDMRDEVDKEQLLRIAELEADARRYRVLRNRDYEFIVEQDRPGWRTTLPIGKGLDAAIDAAINSTKE